MRYIEYRVTYQNNRGAQRDILRVKARSINAGFRKALALALKQLREADTTVEAGPWELCGIEFWKAD